MSNILEKLSSLASLIHAHRPGKEQTAQPPAPKPPVPLNPFYLLSHLEEDGPVRLDGVKLGICEVMGLELDEPRLGSFAGALNALDFPVQLLVRQHPPVLGVLRQKLSEAEPRDLPPGDPGGCGVPQGAAH